MRRCGCLDRGITQVLLRRWWCVLRAAGVVYGVALVNNESLLIPLTATTFPGSGKLRVLAHARHNWKDTARLASVCVQRLRRRLGLKDLWAKDLDLYLGQSGRQAVGRQAPVAGRHWKQQQGQIVMQAG